MQINLKKTLTFISQSNVFKKSSDSPFFICRTRASQSGQSTIDTFTADVFNSDYLKSTHNLLDAYMNIIEVDLSLYISTCIFI